MSKCKTFTIPGLEVKVNEFLANNPDIVVSAMSFSDGVCIIIYNEMLTVTVNGLATFQATATAGGAPT